MTSRVQSAMKEKYPPRSHPMPDNVHSGTCMASLPGLRETLLGLEPGVSAGFGGLRNEHLVCAAKEWSDGEVALLESFSLRYLNGELPPWWYRVWGSVSTIPLFKTLEQDTSKVRPLGIKCSLPKVLHKRVVQANRGALCDFLEPEQLALSPAGGARLVYTVRMCLEKRPDFICMCGIRCQERTQRDQQKSSGGRI